MKTLIINGKLEATGEPDAMDRAKTRILRKKKLENPSVVLTEGIIFLLEEKT
jgi:hypothetical protein